MQKQCAQTTWGKPLGAGRRDHNAPIVCERRLARVKKHRDLVVGRFGHTSGEALSDDYVGVDRNGLVRQSAVESTVHSKVI